MKSAPLSVWLMTVSGFLVAIISLRFLALGLRDAFPDLGMHIDHRQLAFTAHVTAAPIALAAGAVQFFPALRARRPRLHRWTGRIYAVAVLIGGIGGMALAIGAIDRPVAALGFGILAALWIHFTARGVLLARARNFREHRKWMMRSYALTFAAVTLRIMIPVFLFGFGMNYIEASPWLAWASWLPNLAFAEWLIRRNPDPVFPNVTGRA